MKALAILWVTAAGLTAQVTYERIAAAGSEPDSWLTYSGDYAGHRYSALAEIHRGNVARLKPVWMYQTNDLNQFEVTPLVADGVMYISEPPSHAAALDLRTGRPLWMFRRAVPSDVHTCCGQVNRGVAILSDTVFLGTLDAHLLALDAKTGHLLWDTTVADYKAGYSITAAPLALRDKVIVGISGGEYGIRGFLDAYNPKTGKRLWRFWTVPGPGEPGHETWEGDSWKTGSAATWLTGSYDPAANLLYWGTGNPGPDYDGGPRAGDNLYAASLVALDAATGKLRWHFQFTPHDTHDWDANHVPVLLDGTLHGAARRLVAVPNRNGFYYVLDRLTGEFLVGRQYGKQNWAEGLDSRGRPILINGREPRSAGSLVYPGVHGATNWNSPSYSPDTKLLYVAVREEGTVFYRATAEYKAGNYFSAGGMRGIPGVEPTGSIQALDPLTGEKRWEFALHGPPWAGVLSTAGGLVFGGTPEGNVFVLDAASGKPLWTFQAGAAVYASPMSYRFQGRQYLAITAGRSLIVFGAE
ncbi:MAG TPA: PQQ-dependent dehydrogenase, methanol/ethanol family [Candidatus Acidoferrales bacterium]|nr:PQQ-dependent dehydrogenase, methanol/ethanol family [Candidatus Acidoferrales bacterium]